MKTVKQIRHSFPAKLVIVVLLIVAISLMYSNFTRADANLVAHWKFDEGSGTTAFDSSGNEWDGTIVGGATYSTNVPPVNFTNTHSLDFDGIDDGVTTGLSVSNYSEFTLAGWAYPRSGESNEGWFGANNVFEFFFVNDHELRCWAGGANIGINWDFSEVEDFYNNWHHITCLGDGESITLYIDGEQVAHSTHTPSAYGVGDNFSIGIGVQNGGTDGPFDGLIDDVRVYDRALTPEEMDSLGTGDPGPGEAPSISSLSPADDAIDIALDANLEISFDNFIDYIGIDSGNITIYKASDDSVVEVIDAENYPQVSNSGGTVTINPSTTFEKGTEYYVQIDTATFFDGGNPDAYFPGIHDKTTWNFTTIGNGPAGVGESLRLWLTASKGAKNGVNDALNGEEVDTWEDQSTSRRDASKSSSGAIYQTNGLNFNPTLYFADDNYEASNAGLATGTEDRSIFVVASSNAGGWRYVLGAGRGPGGFPGGGLNRGFDFGHNADTSAIFITNHNSASVSLSSWQPYGSARLAYGALSGQTMYLAVNGTAPVAGGGGVETEFQGPLNIGANSADAELWDGNISEVIFYNRVVTPEERQRITSYLALKYGFSLDQTTPQSYLASDDNLMWDKDAPGADTYNNNLFGIGRDDGSELSQVKSVGQAATNILTIEALGEGTNTQPNFDDLDDLEFLVIGDDSGAADWTTTDAPTGYKILERKWAKQEQGDVGEVNLSFDVDDDDLDIPESENGQYALLYDSDNDGDLADETPIALTNTGGSNWATDLNFGSGSMFTLASVDQPKVTALAPSDGATGVSRDTHLTIDFDRVVTAEDGLIVIRRALDNTVIEQMSADDARVTGSGSDTVIIDLNSILDYNTEYEVLIGDDAFVGPGGQYFVGISEGEWDFTTLPDTEEPLIVDLSPNDNAVNVPIGTNLIVTFNEPILTHSGDIVIYRASDDSVFETIPVGGGPVIFDDETLTINPFKNFVPNTEYYILIDNDAIRDTAGNSFSGISNSETWSFTTEDDNDGIDKTVEDNAPNNGDANNDGVPDSEQANVASLVSPIDGQYVAVEVDDTCTLSSVSISNESSHAARDNGYDYATGFVNFTATGCDDSQTEVNIYYQDIDASNVVARKYNPNAETYLTITGASITSLTSPLSGTLVSYTVVDGGELDVDGAVNGTIVDPIGLAQVITAAATSTTNSNVGVPNTGLAERNMWSFVIALLTGSGLVFCSLILLRRQIYGIFKK